jgi:hypothetical protein
VRDSYWKSEFSKGNKQANLHLFVTNRYATSLFDVNMRG